MKLALCGGDVRGLHGSAQPPSGSRKGSKKGDTPPTLAQYLMLTFGMVILLVVVRYPRCLCLFLQAPCTVGKAGGLCRSHQALRRWRQGRPCCTRSSLIWRAGSLALALI